MHILGKGDPQADKISNGQTMVNAGLQKLHEKLGDSHASLEQQFAVLEMQNTQTQLDIKTAKENLFIGLMGVTKKSFDELRDDIVVLEKIMGDAHSINRLEYQAAKFRLNIVLALGALILGVQLWVSLRA